MSDPLGPDPSPFTDDIDGELRRLLRTSWQSPDLIPPRHAGRLSPSWHTDRAELDFWDDETGDRIRRAVPLRLRWLGAAFAGMQFDLCLEGRGETLMRTVGPYRRGERLWLTLLGSRSGDLWGVALDDERPDPDVDRLFEGESGNFEATLSDLLTRLTPG